LEIFYAKCKISSCLLSLSFSQFSKKSLHAESAVATLQGNFYAQGEKSVPTIFGGKGRKRKKKGERGGKGKEEQRGKGKEGKRKIKTEERAKEVKDTVESQERQSKSS
jgi:hypothetical protein